jgi:hypothetical protein
MKAIVFLLNCLLVLFVPLSSFAQQPAAEDVRMEKAATYKENMIFKPVRSGVDNVELIEVIALGTPSFKVSNMADGTYSSYDHSIRITYPLVLAGGKTGYLLCFYGSAEKIPYSVETKGGITTIYFPFATHEMVKARIDQMLTTKKKITIKLSQLADGYREALLGVN